MFIKRWEILYITQLAIVAGGKLERASQCFYFNGRLWKRLEKNKITGNKNKNKGNLADREKS